MMDNGPKNHTLYRQVTIAEEELAEKFFHDYFKQNKNELIRATLFGQATLFGKGHPTSPELLSIRDMLNKATPLTSFTQMEEPQKEAPQTTKPNSP